LQVEEMKQRFLTQQKNWQMLTSTYAQSIK